MKPFGCHPAIRTSGAARFSDVLCISMVQKGTFLRWSAKDNEKSESIVESCLRILMRFLSVKTCMAECFLVLSSQGAARYLAAFVLQPTISPSGLKRCHATGSKAGD